MQKGILVVWSALVFGLAVPTVFESQDRPQSLPTPQGETIQAQAVEVLVDVVVSDRKNRLVTDLSQQDFSIDEDGEPQEITSFRAFRGGTQPAPQPLKRTATTVGKEIPETPASLEPSRLTILLLDYSTTEFENQKLVRDASVKYVESKLQPNDLMAVFALGAGLKLLTDFTSDKSQLIATLKRTDVTGSALGMERASLSSGIAAGASPQVQTENFTLPSGLSGPGAAGAAAGLGAQGSRQAAAMAAQRIAAQYYVLRSALDQRQSRNVLTAIRAIALGVKEIEGRKSLILFSEGFVIGPNLEEELHSVVDLANRSQLAVYCIESQGLETKPVTSELLPTDELNSISGNISQRERMKAYGGESNFDRARQVGSDTRESALRYVANSTGGFLIRNTNDLGVGLDRIDEEMHCYYLLAYRPKNPNFNGQFRQIRVQISRPDLNVKARSGYYAVPPGYDFLTPEEYQLVDRARRVDAASETPLFMRVAGFQEEGNRFRVPIILDIPTSGIDFERNQEVYSARLQVIGLIRDVTGNFLTRFGGPMKLNATEAEYEALKPGTVSFLNTLQLAAGRYSFEVLVKDLPSGRVMHSEQGLNLREPKAHLALSSIVLGKEVDKASSRTEFFSVQGVKLLPSARCQFRNGENLIFYFHIYDPQFSQQKKADVSVRLGLTRFGIPVNARLPNYHLEESLSQPDSHVVFARYLNLAGLEPGDYTLVVDVKDNLGNQTARGQAGFSVAN